jgi:hypothetical protein
MPAKKKTRTAERGPSISGAYYRIIPLAENGAYIQTTDAKSIKVKVGSEVFYTLLAAYIATAAAPIIAAHCEKLAVEYPAAAGHWNNASKMLGVDKDGSPLVTFDDLMAELFPKQDENAEAENAVSVSV